MLLACGGEQLMAISPRIVTQERWISWDGVQQRLPRGQVLDVPPDSPLERAIGREFLVPLPGSAPVQETASKAPDRIGEAVGVIVGRLDEAGVLATAKPKPAPKKQGDAKDGGS